MDFLFGFYDEARCRRSIEFENEKNYKLEHIVDLCLFMINEI